MITLIAASTEASVTRVMDILTPLGLDTRAVPSEEAAIETLRQEICGLAVIVGDPATVSRICRRIRELDGILPILVTGPFEVAEARIEVLNHGADDVVAWPCAREEFLARVRTLIRRNPAQT